MKEAEFPQCEFTYRMRLLADGVGVAEMPCTYHGMSSDSAYLFQARFKAVVARPADKFEFWLGGRLISRKPLLADWWHEDAEFVTFHFPLYVAGM